MDWNYFQVIEALATCVRLNAAAQTLGLDPSTLTRTLQRAEAELGYAVFKRTKEGFVPTAHGKAIVALSLEMKTVVAALGDPSLSPTKLTVTSLEFFLNHYLLPRLIGFPFPIELVEADRNLNLARKEADIAIRFAKPSAGPYKIKELAQVGYAPYALRRRKSEENGWALLSDQFQAIEDNRWFRKHHAGATVRYLMTSYQQILTTVLNQGVTGILPCFIGDRLSQLHRVNSQDPVFFRSAWLVSPADRVLEKPIRIFREWVIAETLKDRDLLAGSIH